MPRFLFPANPGMNYPFTCAGVDEGRAKQLLEKVMNAIPPVQRALLRAFWFKNENGRPTVIFEDTDLLTVKRDDGTAIALGHNTAGHVIRFAGQAIAQMSNDLAEKLIAHEFGHSVVEREERDEDLPDDDAAVIAAFDAEVLAVAGDGEVANEAAVKAKLIEQLPARSKWCEAAVNKRTQAWNAAYDDTAIRDWLIDYLEKKKAKPPAGA